MRPPTSTPCFVFANRRNKSRWQFPLCERSPPILDIATSTGSVLLPRRVLSLRVWRRCLLNPCVLIFPSVQSQRCPATTAQSCTRCTPTLPPLPARRGDRERSRRLLPSPAASKPWPALTFNARCKLFADGLAQLEVTGELVGQSLTAIDVQRNTSPVASFNTHDLLVGGISCLS